MTYRAISLVGHDRPGLVQGLVTTRVEYCPRQVLNNNTLKVKCSAFKEETTDINFSASYGTGFL